MITHKLCGGNIIEDLKAIPYTYTDDDGNASTVPVYRCEKCGEEILGDADIEEIL